MRSNIKSKSYVRRSLKHSPYCSRTHFNKGGWRIFFLFLSVIWYRAMNKRQRQYAPPSFSPWVRYMSWNNRRKKLSYSRTERVHIFAHKFMQSMKSIRNQHPCKSSKQTHAHTKRAVHIIFTIIMDVIRYIYG